MTACNLCSAAPRGGWSQTEQRPGTAGRENTTVTSLWTQLKALPGKAGGSRASIPSGWEALAHTLPGTHQAFSSLRNGSTQRAGRPQGPQHRADHGIPGAGTPPGSHWPRGRGRGRDGFLLHLLCVPAALPASVLKGRQSERVPEGRRGCGLSPTGLLCRQRQL